MKMLLYKQLRFSWSQIKRNIASQSRLNKSSVSSSEVRSQFIKYFTNQKDHLFVPSSPVTLSTDESLIFVSAGMNQFKPIFLGQVPTGDPMSSYRRVVNSQKCIRVGGKHNDLDDVGHDGSHHTFFEMLGNWSFSDYFKKDACQMAWDLLTQHFGLPKNRLYVTYFAGDPENELEPDLETRDIWLNLGVPADRVIPFGIKDNFWDMGKRGPCGPCSEIHYDHVGSRQCRELINTGDPDVVEVWNLVFMQYDRLDDGSLRKLPNVHVDTGMGLERLTAILQGSKSNYDTDLFHPLFSVIHKQSSVRPYQGLMGSNDIDEIDTAYRIVADHARMFSVSISDGVVPDEVGAGHCLRRIIRRAVLTAKTKLGATGILSHIVDPVVESLGDAYPALNENFSKIKSAVVEEENRFLNQLSENEARFDDVVAYLQSKVFPGEEMFRLSCYGIPEDILLDLIQSRGLIPDIEAYNKIKIDILEKDKSIRAAKLLEMVIKEKKFLNQSSTLLLQEHGIETTDDSYKYLLSENKELSSKILKIYHNGRFLDELTENESGCLILAATNFFSEAGGQSCDKGCISNENFEFEVEEVKVFHGYVQHYGKVIKGQITLNDVVSLQVDEKRRNACARSHTATHLLADSLNILIPECKPSSFNSEPDYIGLSIKSEKNLSRQQVKEIEHLVNKVIKENTSIEAKIISKSEAINIPNLLTVSDVNYPDPMRIILIENQTFRSAEACCGTHVKNSGEVGVVVVVSQKAISQTSRRVRAVSGNLATTAIQHGEKLLSELKNLKNLVKSTPRTSDDQTINDIINRVQKGIRKIRWELKENVIPYLVRTKLETDTEGLKRKITFLIQKRDDYLKNKEMPQAT